GMVRSTTTHRRDLLDTAEVDIEFVEEAAAPAPAARVSIGGATVEAFEAAQAEQMEAFRALTREVLGSEGARVLARELDPEQPSLVQFTGLSRAARAFLKAVDGEVAAAEAVLASVTAPANSIVSTIDYGLTLPGRVVGGLARAA